jgi:sugar phosphate isomerase/epimerase
MKAEFSLAHLTVLACPPAEVVYMAARAGYDYVSLRPIPMRLPGEPNWAFATNPHLLAQTRAALAATGMRVYDIELARLTDDIEVREYLPEIEIAAEMGARAVLTSIWTPDRATYVRKFAELCDLAKPFGMTVDLEFVAISPVNTLAKVVDVLGDVKRDNAGLMLDMHHFCRSGDKPEALAALPREWFHFAHVNALYSEYPATREEMTRMMREERLYLGEGDFDVAGVLRAIPRVVHSMELPHGARSREWGYAEHVFRILETAKAYFAANELD